MTKLEPEVIPSGGSARADLLASIVGDPRLMLLLLDDRPAPHALAAGLQLKAEDARIFVADTAAVAYEALLLDPFPFDAVYVDWRFDTWSPLDREFSGRFGIPDNVAKAGLMDRAFRPRSVGVAADTDASHGGHAELLLLLAKSRGCMVAAVTVHAEASEAVLRARGASVFLDKGMMEARTPQMQSARDLLLEAGGSARDLRLWRAVPLNQLKAVLKYLEETAYAELWKELRRGEAMPPEARHSAALASAVDEASAVRFRVASLAWLQQPRLYCASRLIDKALASNSEGSGSSGELLARASMLQPSLIAPRLDSTASIAKHFRDLRDRIEQAHGMFELEEGEDYLHVVAGDGLQRVDFYAGKAVPSPGAIQVRQQPLTGSALPVEVEYLGTAFGPRLATATDENGVWPAAKSAKLRHLLRGSRERRVFHHGNALVHCADGVFGPTIDSLILGQLLIDLAQGNNVVARAERVAEVGTGTGYLAAILLAQARGVRFLAVSDTSLKAVRCCYRNLDAACQEGVRGGWVHVAASSDVLGLCQEASLDLIVSNPPYLPSPPTRDVRDSATAGRRVIEDILCGSGPRALRESGAVLIVASTLTEEFIVDAMEKAKRGGHVWHRRILVRKEWVPLDLPEVHGDPEWVEFLLARGESGVTFDSSSGQYPLRHGVVVTALARDETTLSELADAVKKP